MDTEDYLKIFARTEKLFINYYDKCNFTNKGIYLNFIFYLKIKKEHDLLLSSYKKILQNLFKRITTGYFNIININNLLKLIPKEEKIDETVHIKFNEELGKLAMDTYLNQTIDIIQIIYTRSTYNIKGDQKNHFRQATFSFINQMIKLFHFYDGLLSCASYYDVTGHNRYKFHFYDEFPGFNDYSLSFEKFKITKNIFSKLFLIVPLHKYLPHLFSCQLYDAFTISECKKIYDKRMLVFNTKNYKYYMPKFKDVVLIVITCNYVIGSCIFNLPWELVNFLLNNILSIKYKYHMRD